MAAAQSGVPRLTLTNSETFFAREAPIHSPQARPAGPPRAFLSDICKHLILFASVAGW